MNCSYTSYTCGPGFLTIGGSCFLYKRLYQKASWMAAEEMCSRYDAKLATLNTERKWKEALDILNAANWIVKKVFVGLTSSLASQHLWYSRLYRWADGSTAFYLNTVGNGSCTEKHKCGYLARKENVAITMGSFCHEPIAANVLCEKQTPTENSVTFPNRTNINGSHYMPEVVPCPAGHVVHLFLACDVKTACWRSEHWGSCEAGSFRKPPMFACGNQVEHIPYTLLCDHRADCVDGSDEVFCEFSSCSPEQENCGDSKQCIPKNKACDGWADCVNGMDESPICPSQPTATIQTTPSPAIVTLTNASVFTVTPVNPEALRDQDPVCPETHFQCSDDGYCLPILLRCNGVKDCPLHEDEQQCHNYICPGFYRCRASLVCLHPSQICDGWAQCGQHDDELLCGFVCPPPCVCHGLSFFCSRSFEARTYPQIRFLDASDTGVTPGDLSPLPLLIYLRLDRCNITRIVEAAFPNMLILHLKGNRLTALQNEHLQGMPRLRQLVLAGNPLLHAFDSMKTVTESSDLKVLDLSYVPLLELNISAFSFFPSLRTLNLSGSGIQRVVAGGFQNLKQLGVIDMRGCPLLWFPRDLFHGLQSLHTVHADNFRLCCPAVLPLYFKRHQCFAPADEISSCDDLLQSDVYTFFVFLFCLSALLGNSISFVYRTLISDRKVRVGFGAFVTHLSVSDFLMGVYLAVIGMADRLYQGSYVWNDLSWRHSVACRAAGFLSLLSSEVSALIMCLITLDRFLVLRFPFRHLHFSFRSAHVASLLVWLCGGTLASVPLVPATSRWEFYSQTGICIPLPITRNDFPGHTYSFSIVIIFNFILFLFICIGQLNIYWSVRANSLSVSSTSKKSKDLSIAHRLVTVAMTDFMCWFPIGLLGLLASSGVPISSEINVAVAIFVLPLNSALNPCLYTVNVILERRSKRNIEKIMKLLASQQTKAQNPPPGIIA